MYKFKIESLNCMSCLHNIEEALKEVDLNVIAKADIKNQLLFVESKEPVEKLSKLIEESGYPVSEVLEG